MRWSMIDDCLKILAMKNWVAALVLFALSVAPASARGPDSLTPEVRQHLSSLSARRQDDRVRPHESFWGRPVLVKFFASW